MIRPSVRARFAALRRFLDRCFVAVYSFRKNRQEHSPLAALLTDDFYLLEREYLSVREALRQNGKNRRNFIKKKKTNFYLLEKNNL